MEVNEWFFGTSTWVFMSILRLDRIIIIKSCRDLTAIRVWLMDIDVWDPWVNHPRLGLHWHWDAICRLFIYWADKKWPSKKLVGYWGAVFSFVGLPGQSFVILMWVCLKIDCVYTSIYGNLVGKRLNMSIVKRVKNNFLVSRIFQLSLLVNLVYVVSCV